MRVGNRYFQKNQELTTGAGVLAPVLLSGDDIESFVRSEARLVEALDTIGDSRSQSEVAAPDKCGVSDLITKHKDTWQEGGVLVIFSCQLIGKGRQVMETGE